jgi:hypothetical protein
MGPSGRNCDSALFGRGTWHCEATGPPHTSAIAGVQGHLSVGCTVVLQRVSQRPAECTQRGA